MNATFLNAAGYLGLFASHWLATRSPVHFSRIAEMCAALVDAWDVDHDDQCTAALCVSAGCVQAALSAAPGNDVQLDEAMRLVLFAVSGYFRAASLDGAR